MSKVAKATRKGMLFTQKASKQASRQASKQAKGRIHIRLSFLCPAMSGKIPATIQERDGPSKRRRSRLIHSVAGLSKESRVGHLVLKRFSVVAAGEATSLSSAAAAASAFYTALTLGLLRPPPIVVSLLCVLFSWLSSTKLSTSKPNCGNSKHMLLNSVSAS